ncbi:MAG: hypothetical protein ACD_41C00241G0005 [uncultured bacterium]|nr:MAG: hypothetical protein ACD_41C00241G0005 [uncultured bacterium]HBY74013.1 tRNA (adenosine(37)-N6)-threonylcarbamoyltransferase complex ATPase subunit type 1 TsaE [Candidatus Kerfeldbacteria bacterium]
MKKAVCQSASDGVTKAFARKLVTSLTNGGLLLLEGELGAGKTTFVQGIAEALGVTQRVTSPTFTLLNVYETHHHFIRQLVHIDLYRLHSATETTELDIPLWLSRPDALVVVEWPERAPELWKNALGTIRFQLGEISSHRVLEVEGQMAAVFGATE